jgi:hypothetical protein
LDSCSTHCDDKFFEISTGIGISPVFMLPHSSDEMHALYVGLCGIHKIGITRIFPPDWLTIQSKQIYRLLGAWIAAATSPHIISALK